MMHDVSPIYTLENSVLNSYRCIQDSTGTIFRFEIPHFDNLPTASADVTKSTEEERKFDSRGGVKTLLELCINFVAHNITNVDSLVDFPELIGEQIFFTALKAKSGILNAANDSQCAKIFSTFDAAYGSRFLSELRVKSLPFLEQHIETLSSLTHLSTLNVSGCRLGDSHEFIQLIASLSLLTDLCLQDTALSDEGIRRLTANARVYNRGFKELRHLDISYNRLISEKCGRYLHCFPSITALCLTGTAVKVSEATRMAVQLNLVLHEGDGKLLPLIDCSRSKGWAADLVDDWIDPCTRSHRATTTNMQTPRSSSFYSKPTKLVQRWLDSEPQVTRNSKPEIILVRPSTLPSSEKIQPQQKLSAATQNSYTISSAAEVLSSSCIESADRDTSQSISTSASNASDCLPTRPKKIRLIGGVRSGVLDAVLMQSSGDESTDSDGSRKLMSKHVAVVTARGGHKAKSLGKRSLLEAINW